MPKFIPTLGITGWSNDSADVADYMLSCYITTNRSDSVLHNQQNTSMQYTLKEFADNMLAIEDRMQKDLLAKFQSMYGKAAEVIVDVSSTDPDKPGQYTISFTGTVYDNQNKAYTVGKLVYLDDGRVVKIANINNG